jgi:hypothetical protein
MKEVKQVNRMQMLIVSLFLKVQTENGITPDSELRTSNLENDLEDAVLYQTHAYNPKVIQCYDEVGRRLAQI